MKIFLTLFCFLLMGNQQTATVYVCRDLKCKLFSEAPLENIEATSVKGYSVMNVATGEIQISIPVNTFRFSKSLMQEHFNENYMESDKYPDAKFKGKVNEKISLLKDGEYPVTATGELEVHGVKQQRTINGTIKVNAGTFSIHSTFTVLCKDHQVKIPTLVFKNIAESIQITVDGNYSAFSSTKS